VRGDSELTCCLEDSSVLKEEANYLVNEIHGDLDVSGTEDNTILGAWFLSPCFASF
jgi:hypothetical protein